MNDSQKARVSPHWAIITLFMDSGQWVGGSDATNILNQVNMEMGNQPTCLNCPADIAQLLRATYYNYLKDGKA